MFGERMLRRVGIVGVPSVGIWEASVLQVGGHANQGGRHVAGWVPLALCARCWPSMLARQGFVGLAGAQVVDQGLSRCVRCACSAAAGGAQPVVIGKMHYRQQQ
jgi:hypothetical protein